MTIRTLSAKVLDGARKADVAVRDICAKQETDVRSSIRRRGSEMRVRRGVVVVFVDMQQQVGKRVEASWNARLAGRAEEKNDSSEWQTIARHGKSRLRQHAMNAKDRSRTEE